MQKRTWKRIALLAASLFLLGSVTLAAHLWWVTKPHIDASTRVLERIDLHQPIDAADVSRITAWLYQQKGVDHVLVNPQTAIAIFSFAPVQNDGNRIAADLARDLPYKQARRNLPTKSELAGSCPAGY
ncbi:MAG TPA: hypothetical protein VGM89_12430 [Puia sp.]|jgi:hypothetical protein